MIAYRVGELVVDAVLNTPLGPLGPILVGVGYYAHMYPVVDVVIPDSVILFFKVYGHLSDVELNAASRVFSKLSSCERAHIT